ncbi:MAG: class I SAM-dependent methyltransferase [Magnetococcales bacterium]|nr:class I SAM-dependent methyltransferase [Magnetococcales bacterium]
MTMVDPVACPATHRLLEALLALWPDHRRYLEASFALRSPEALAATERTAALVERLAGPELPRYCEDYRFKCRLVQMEELHFRRTGHYRLSSFAQAKAEVYDNGPFMERYLNGILMTHIFWSNHAAVMHGYQTVFLPGNAPDYRHLEVGPGHGLLLHYAASDPRCAQATGWDISDASLAATAASLRLFGGAEHRVSLVKRDLFAADGNEERFDSIVISEVLEHLETPGQALALLARRLTPEGRMFIHVPVNGPSPDHIYLLRSPEEVTELVTSAGLRPLLAWIIPGTGYDEARARKEALMLSCVVIAGPGDAAINI